MTGAEVVAAPVLVLRGVVLAAGGAPYDLVLRPGEVAALSDPDSSDLLWAVAGLGDVVSGQILVDDRVIATHEDALAAGVALVPQGSALASLLTALENVLLPLAEQSAQDPVPEGSAAESDLAARARQALADVGLAESADHLVEELSGGQQQRVAVARAVAARPRLLLADQATTDLDAGNRARVVDLLRTLAASGTAVLLVSDDAAVVERCDRIITRSL